MASVVNTNVEGLKTIRDSLIRFQEQIQPLRSDLIHSFEAIDSQLIDNYNRFERQLEERRRKGSDEGRTDSFACDKCGGHIRLKIKGDTTHCREAGCNGTLHRYYNDSAYTSQQRRRDIEELKEIRALISNYNHRKEELLSSFISFFSSNDGNINAGKASLGKCISTLEEYLGTEIFVETTNEGKKKR